MNASDDACRSRTGEIWGLLAATWLSGARLGLDVAALARVAGLPAAFGALAAGCCLATGYAARTPGLRHLDPPAAAGRTLSGRSA